MRVLVTGAAGQLGHDVLALLRTRGIECRGADLAEFDLTDGAAAKAFVTAYAPTVIVHCAAYTNVDKAESEPEVCARVNRWIHVVQMDADTLPLCRDGERCCHHCGKN